MSPAAARKEIDVLDALARFEGLTPADRDALVSCGVVRPVRAHRELVAEGERSDTIQLLLNGWACRQITRRDGSRQIIGLVLPGDFANLDAIALGQVDFSVRMLSVGDVLAIPRRDIANLVERSPGMARMLLRMIAIENAVLGKWALCLGRMAAPARIAHLLCELATRLTNSPDGTSTEFELPMTQEQIADVVGLTAVHVNRVLQRLREDGLIVSRGRTVSIPNLPALKRTGEFQPNYLHLAPRPTPERRTAGATGLTA